jgi:hypothetical protein
MTEYVINKTIRIVTSFSYSTIMQEEKQPVISYDLYYPVEHPTALMSGLLTGENRQVVRCKAPGGYIHGHLLTTLSEDEMVLFGNLFYGPSPNEALQSHFEGTIAIYPYEKVIVEPVSPLVPLSEGSREDVAPGMSLGAPLFPYIDVQAWPVSPAAPLPWQFFSYDPANTPATSLYTLLLVPKGNNDRAGMENLALQFLQNESPFTGNYFGSLDNVPVPFNGFPPIYNALRESDGSSNLEDLLLELVGFDSMEDYMAWLLENNYDQVKDEIWQNYFALAIFAGYQEHFFIAINKILLLINLIDELYQSEITSLPLEQSILPCFLQATVLLPNTLFPLPSYVEVALISNRVKPYAIGQLKMTRYQLQSYSLGEVALIVNVLKGEKKKVVRRSLSHQGEQSTHHTQNDSEQSNQSNESTHELASEVQKTIAALTKSLNYTNLTVSYGPPSQAVYNGSYTNSITAGAPGVENTNSFATTVINKTLNRIQESVLKSRTSYSYGEQEETQSSLFDNQQGQDNFRGVYRWVNKVYRISLENYGYRFLLQLNMRKPARDFIATQQTLNNTNLEKPLSPQQQKINSFSDITTDNYITLLSYYQVAKMMLPPEASLTTSVTVGQSETEKYIPVPSGYQAATATVTGQIGAGALITAITGIVGTTPFSVTNAAPKQSNITLDNEITQVALAVAAVTVPGVPAVQPGDFVLVATVVSNVSDNKVNEWKLTVYNEIREAYQQLMRQYNEHITRFAREDQTSNPLLLNTIERTALSNNCIGMLLHVNAEKVGLAGGGTGTSEIGIEQGYRQFLEKALEWDEMTWSFNDQPAKYSYAFSGTDDSLRPFLQANTATVFLPVRPDFNFQVLYYLMTGLIWWAGYPFVPVNIPATSSPDFSSLDIATRLKNISHWHHEGQEEKHWHVTLPTTMQVIQEGNHLPNFITPK